MAVRRLSLGVAAVLAVAGTAVATAPLAGVAAAADPSVSLVPIRTIGGTGHAGLYGWGVAYDPTDDTILVGDYWNFRVARFNTDGTSAGPDPVTIANKGSANNESPDPLLHQSPYGLAVDPTNGDFYFGDVDGGKTVDKYSHDGGDATMAFGSNGAGVNKFKYPSRVVVAPNRNVYVIDQWDHFISVHNPTTGAEIAASGGNGAGNGQFKQPRGAALTTPTAAYPQGLLYVADNYNGRVQVLDAAKIASDPNNAFVTKWGSKGANPGQFGTNADLRGLAIDNDNGWVYVADASTGFVNKYDLAGNYLLRFGGYAAGDGQFVGGPREVAVDGDGNVWVGDMPGFRVLKFDPLGNVLLQVPTPAAPPPPGGFNQPRGVAVDQNNRIFVSDTHNWRIQKLDNDANATFMTEWGNRGGGPFGFNYQRGLAVDRRDGAVVVADTDNHMIAKFTNSGQFVWERGGFGTGNNQFSNPHSVAVGPDGRIYVPDTQNRRIVVLDEDGNYLYKFGSKGNGDGQFQFPRSVTVDPVDESLWVSDSIRGDVQHFSNSGTFLGKFGSLGSADNQLLRAADVEVNADYVFVADVDTHKIKIWTKAGAFVGFGGGGGREFGQLLNPHGMDIAPDGTLYVAEQTGERITQFRIVVAEADTVPPTVTPTAPAANASVPLPSVTLAGTASDNRAVSRVEVAIRSTATGLYLRADGSWGLFTWLPTTLDAPGAATSGYSRTFAPPAVGGYSFQSRAFDDANLQSVLKPSRSFTVFDPSVVTDTVLPTVAATSPTANQVVAGPTVNLQGTAADNVAVASADFAVKNISTGLWLRPGGTWGAFAWNPATVAAPGQSSSSFALQFTAPNNGGYGFQARSRDTSGNASAATTFRSFSVS